MLKAREFCNLDWKSFWQRNPDSEHHRKAGSLSRENFGPISHSKNRPRRSDRKKFFGPISQGVRDFGRIVYVKFREWRSDRSPVRPRRSDRKIVFWPHLRIRKSDTEIGPKTCRGARIPAAAAFRLSTFPCLEVTVIVKMASHSLLCYGIRNQTSLDSWRVCSRLCYCIVFS